MRLIELGGISAATLVVAVACASGNEAGKKKGSGGGAGEAGSSMGDASAGTGGTAAVGGTGGSSGGAAGSGGAGTGGAAGSSEDAGADSSSGGMAGSAGTSDAGPDALPCEQIPETCNGLDDNCNGSIDEGDPGGGGTCVVSGQSGVCADGIEHCTTGIVQCEQQVTPSSEICNGLDDNCNGPVDEGNPEGGDSCNTGLEGVCAAGTTQCSGGQVACEPNLTPTTETCNGLDDDCDGVPDNGFPGTGQPCTVPGFPPGTPCADGLTNCLGGQNNCSQTTFAEAEICDNVDNDCNGTIDDSSETDGKPCTTGMPGICAAGLTDCTGGVETCIATNMPGIETCNGLDDDCNGPVDDVANITLDCSTRFPLATNVVSWVCTTGFCEVLQCSTNFADCDGAPANGCEVDLQNDPLHCSGCTLACDSTNGTSSCSGGNCAIVCNGGFGNCDGDVGNGCEQPLNTTQHCAGCGTACAPPNATGDCSSGTCQVGSCNSGFDDCTGAAGCETELGTDESHCGECGRACSSTNVATLQCTGGLCTSSCTPVFGNCSTPAAPTADDGCETDLTVDCSPCGCVTEFWGENTADDHQGVTEDTYLHKDNANRNYGGRQWMTIGTGPARRPLIRFDLNAIPATAVVVSANLHLYNHNNGSNNSTTIHQVLESWVEGNLDNQNGDASWNERSPGVSWANVGADSPTSSAAASVGNFAPSSPAGTLYIIPIDRTLVQGWVDGTITNYGVTLRHSGGTATVVSSENASKDGQRPRFEVTYVP